MIFHFRPVRRSWGSQLALLPLLCLLVFVSHAPLFAKIELPNKDFYFKHLLSSQGLSDGIVNDVMRDHKGYLWIATFGGLNCFDGHHFKVWKSDPFREGHLESNVVQSICEDRAGNIWVATDGGISRFDRNTFRTYPLVNSVGGVDEVTMTYEILCSSRGEIITVTHSGIYVLDTLQDKFIHYPAQPGSPGPGLTYVYKNSLCEDPNEPAIWIGTRGGLWRFDLNDHSYTHRGNNPRGLSLFAFERVFPITTDHHESLVFHDNNTGKLCTYNTRISRLDSTSTRAWLDEPLITSTILVDKAGNQWISSWNYKLFFIHGRSNRVYSMQHSDGNAYSIAGDFFWGVYQDSDETIYLGTVNGLSFTNLKSSFFSIVNFPENENHATDYFGSVILNTDNRDRIWLAPSFTHLLCYDPATSTFKKHDFLAGKVNRFGDQALVNCMVPCGDTLFFGTDLGLYTFDQRTEQFAPFKAIPKEEYAGMKNLKVMHLSKKGDLWLVMEWNGVLKYNVHSGEMKHYRHDSTDQHSITKRLIGSIHEDAEGQIWMSAYLDGILKYNEATDAFDYPIRDGKVEMPQGDFGKIQHDPNNNIWFMNSVTGLCKFYPKTGVVERDFKAFGLDEVQMGDILMAPKGQLWITFYGKYLVLNTNNNSIERFQIDHSQHDYQYMNKLRRMPDGHIVSESRNSFVIFYPEIHNQYQFQDPIILSNFSTADTNILFFQDGQTIKLAHWQNNFSIDFSTIGFLKEKNLSFAYQLEGFDEDWVESGQRQTAYYTNVPGGKYVFKVKFKDYRGQWKEGDATISIQLATVFYKTMWFRLLLAVILLVLVLWYWRLWRLQARKREFDRAVNYFANSKFGNNNVEDILWDIAHNVITRTDLVDCVVYLIDESSGMLVQRSAFGEKNPREYLIKNPIRIPVGQGIVGAVAQSGKTEIVNDTTRDARYILDEKPNYSEMAVPILFDGKVLGVIDSEHPDKRFFKKDHQDLIEAIAGITSTKLVTAWRELEILEKEKRLKELQAQVTETRQLALRAQMNPHFIFNCLNSINSFILENDADTASTFLIKFAKLIRLILDNSNMRLIPLQSELDALKLYIEMEALRFEQRFTYSIEIGEGIGIHEIQVPPLILQPFVENAIWHGLLHLEGPGQLWVRIVQQGDFLRMEIEDNGVGREAAALFKSKNATQKKSLGMELTKERLALMNEQDQRKFSVEIKDRLDQEGHVCGTHVILEMDI